MSIPAPSATISLEELEDATARAKTKLAQLAGHVIGSKTLEDSHAASGFPHKLQVSVDLFKRAHPDHQEFTVSDLFAYLREEIADYRYEPINPIMSGRWPKLSDPDSAQTMEKYLRSAEHIRESRACAEHLLVALGLSKQFMLYNREQNAKPLKTETPAMIAPNLNLTISRADLEAASTKAQAVIKEIAERNFPPAEKKAADNGQVAPDQNQKDRHAAKSYANNVDTLVQLFMIRNGDGQKFDKATFFDYIRNSTQDVYEKPARKKRDAPADAPITMETATRPPHITRENLAGCQHLLDALELKKQYAEYIREYNKHTQTENART